MRRARGLFMAALLLVGAGGAALWAHENSLPGVWGGAGRKRRTAGRV
jgi:hypothetical protein